MKYLLILVSFLSLTRQQENNLTPDLVFFMEPWDIGISVLTQMKDKFLTAYYDIAELKSQVVMMRRRVTDAIQFFSRTTEAYWNFLLLPNQTQAECDFTRIDAWMECRDSIFRTCGEDFFNKCENKPYLGSPLARTFQSDEIPENFTFFQIPQYWLTKYEATIVALSNRTKYNQKLTSHKTALSNLLVNIRQLERKVQIIVQNITLALNEEPARQSGQRYLKTGSISGAPTPEPNYRGSAHKFFLEHVLTLKASKQKAKLPVSQNSVRLHSNFPRRHAHTQGAPVHSNSQHHHHHTRQKRSLPFRFTPTNMLCGNDINLAIQHCLTKGAMKCRNLIQRSCPIFDRNRREFLRRLQRNTIGAVLSPHVIQTFNNTYAELKWADIDIPRGNSKLLNVSKLTCLRGCAELVVEYSMFNTTKHNITVEPSTESLPREVANVLTRELGLLTTV